MATTTEIQARLEALRKAIATGVRQVQFGGRTVMYQSTAEMREVERDLAAQLAARPKQTLLVASKGF